VAALHALHAATEADVLGFLLLAHGAALHAVVALLLVRALSGGRGFGGGFF